MTEQRILSILKANIKLHISHFDSRSISVHAIGLEEAAQQIMKELDTKEVPEYVECVSLPGEFIHNFTLSKIYPVEYIKSVRGEIWLTITNDSGEVSHIPNPFIMNDHITFNPSTKEAYEQQQEEWPKVGDIYFMAEPLYPELYDECKCNNSHADQHRKDNNLIFKTREEAVARAKEMLRI